MAKYQLTEKQRNILRKACEGLRDGNVARKWDVLTHGGEYLGEGLSGFPGAIDMGLSLTDIRDFVEQGFLRQLTKNKGFSAYEVLEQKILDAVDGNFEGPKSYTPVALPTSIIIEQGAGSYLNMAVNSENITQTIHSNPSLPDHFKEQLEQEVKALYVDLQKTQDTYPNQSKSVDKHLRRLVEDMGEIEPNRADITDSLRRLKKAGQALASVSQILTAIERIGELIAQLPFMN